MKHELFIDGTVKEYSWSIKTGNEVINQDREHPPSYLSGGKLEIKNNVESKFVSIHIGIYWGLGVFIIKDYDTVNVMCDSKEMYEILHNNNKTDNQIINDKIYYINQLSTHRNLKVGYQMIEPEKNLAMKHLTNAKRTHTTKNSREFV